MSQTIRFRLIIKGPERALTEVAETLDFVDSKVAGFKITARVQQPQELKLVGDYWGSSVPDTVLCILSAKNPDVTIESSWDCGQIGLHANITHRDGKEIVRLHSKVRADAWQMEEKYWED